jgi:hypothetical protein
MRLDTRRTDRPTDYLSVHWIWLPTTYTSIPKMEAVCSFEMLISRYKTTRPHSPYHQKLNSYFACFFTLSRVTYMSDYRRGLDWWVDTHDSEIQAITAPPLIFTIHKFLQHQLSLFQPVVSSPPVPWQRLLTVEILQLHVLWFYLFSLLYRTA